MNAVETLACSVESLQVNEPLLGTAPRGDVWFALEVPAPWANKAFQESSVPETVRNHVNAQLKLIPESRLLLTRQNNRPAGGIAFMAAVCNVEKPALYRFELKNYEDLTALNLSAIAAEDPAYQANIATEPVFFICTNGRRDPCCAQQGVGVYRKLSERFGPAIWESTHHGGHRFAANMLAIPAGLSYGRLRPENAIGVVQDFLDGAIAHENFRGRTALEEPLQAAEGLLHRQLGLRSATALRLVSAIPVDANHWRARFAHNGANHDVLVGKHQTSAQTHLSCGDDKLGPVVQFELLEHKIA